MQIKPIPNQDQSGTVALLADLNVTTGLTAGLAMALGLSIYAGGIFAIYALIRLVTGPAAFVAELPEMLLSLVWIVIAYFGAFALAGVLVGMVNAVRAGTLRYPLLGFVLGSAIYGGVSVAMKVGGLFEEPQPSWLFVGGMALFMGILWSIGGTLIGVRRWLKGRKARGASGAGFDS